VKASVRKGKGENRNVGTLVDASQHLELEDHIINLYGTPHARMCGYCVFRFSDFVSIEVSGQWPPSATEKIDGNLSMLLKIAK